MSIRALAIAMLFCLPMSALGLIFIYGSFGAADRDDRIVEAGAHATGRITDKYALHLPQSDFSVEFSDRGSSSKRPDPEYWLEYEFRLPSGRLVSGRTVNKMRLWKRLQRGDSVVVYYDKADPRRNFMAGAGFSRALAVGLAVMGAIAQIPLVIFLIWFFQSRRKSAAQA